MNTAISSPEVIAPVDETANGENQSSVGSIAPGPAVPGNTRTRATTAKAARVTISAVSSPRCGRGVPPLPITQKTGQIADPQTPDPGTPRNHRAVPPEHKEPV